MRITKEDWRAMGGLRNSRLYRKMYGGRWYYYEG